MVDEQEFREWLSKYTKEQLIDLYIQKTFDVYMTTKYGEGGCEFEDKCENGKFATSGYLQEINPDGTSKYPVDEHIETTVYCSSCAEKEEKILKLTKKLEEAEAKLKLLKKLHKKY